MATRQRRTFPAQGRLDHSRRTLDGWGVPPPPARCAPKVRAPERDQRSCAASPPANQAAPPCGMADSPTSVLSRRPPSPPTRRLTRARRADGPGIRGARAGRHKRRLPIRHRRASLPTRCGEAHPKPSNAPPRSRSMRREEIGAPRERPTSLLAARHGIGSKRPHSDRGVRTSRVRATSDHANFSRILHSCTMNIRSSVGFCYSLTRISSSYDSQFVRHS